MWKFAFLAGLLAIPGLPGCQRSDPATAVPDPVQTLATPNIDTEQTATSASLAGVAHDADPDPASLRDPFVLPGPFSPATEPAGLRRIYGADNVREGEVPGAEGEVFHGVILFPQDATRRAYVYFQDEDTLTGLSMIEVTDAESRWKLDTGVRIGMPLPELVALNGKPVKFFGFDWDYGGHITDWHGGKLAPKDGEAIRRIRLDIRESTDGHPGDAYPTGEGEFVSDDRHYPKMGDIVIVGELSVSFPGDKDR
jgi:hypothetical protein